MAYCKCCHLEDALFGPPRSFNGLPVAQIACDLCAKHQGSHVEDFKKREKMHCEMWAESKREALEDLGNDYEVKLSNLKDEIAGLKQELDERPVQVVTENLDAGVVAEAHEDARGAYRSRDTAFRRMTQVHMLHHESRAGYCRCGREIDDCEVAALVEGFRALKTWEWVNSERRRKRQVHSLPKDHPGIVDARWDPDSDEIREFDYYEESDPI